MNTHRVSVLSVGSAQPDAARVIATGFNVEPEEAVRCIYRAPSVLVEDVEAPVAAELVKLLNRVGLEVESQPMTEKPRPPARLYDVGVYVGDERRAVEAADVIGEFMGASRDNVLDILRTPPGVVLGNVSEATVAALAERLEGVAELTHARAEDSTFSIIMATEDGVLKNRVLQDIERHGIELLGNEGLIAREIDNRTIRDVWQRHGPSGAIVVVNEAFLRFNIVLLDVDDDTTAASAALQRHAGIPAELVDRVIESRPITLNSAVLQADVGPILQAYAEAGIVGQADMITFQQEVLQVTECADAAVLAKMLEHMGLESPRGSGTNLPFVIPAALGELDARIWKTALQDAGLRVEFCGVS